MNNTQAQERALLPCPFCGLTLTPNRSQTDLYVRRYGTHFDHPDSDCYLSGVEVRPSAVDEWNRRATPPTAAPEGVGKELLRDAAECLAWYYENPSPVDLIGLRQKQAAKLARKLRAAAAAAAPEGPQSAPAAPEAELAAALGWPGAYPIQSRIGRNFCKKWRGFGWQHKGT